VIAALIETVLELRNATADGNLLIRQTNLDSGLCRNEREAWPRATANGQNKFTLPFLLPACLAPLTETQEYRDLCLPVRLQGGAT
jgi:hypothetical protein